MRNSIFFSLTIIVIMLFHSCRTDQSSGLKPPNVIFILADDLGYSELACYGSTFNETPNLDELAELGVRFTQAYAAAPVCSPYRAALMTGQYPARIGITDYLRPGDNVFLDTAYTTLPEALKLNGYHTGIIGKWHLSGYLSADAEVEILPDKQGFDEVYSSENRGIANCSFFYPYHFNHSLEKKLDTEHEFLIDRMNYEALNFIENNKDSTFFLFLSHYAVHTLLHGEPEVVNHFRDKENSGTSSPSKNNPEDDPYKKWPSDFMASENNPHLAAQLKVIDEGVGMIRNKLAELGIGENTIIIFTSDNGGESRVTSNDPLREGKSTLYEGGIRIPLIFYQPGQITGGKTITSLSSNYDLFPTICELTGTEIPESQKIDGVSLGNVLTGNKNDKTGPRSLYWHYPLEKRHFLGGRSSGAIRKGNWKLIEFFDNGENELYNLEEDIGETNNIIEENPEIASDLLNELENWRENVISDE